MGNDMCKWCNFDEVRRAMGEVERYWRADNYFLPPDLMERVASVAITYQCIECDSGEIQYVATFANGITLEVATPCAEPLGRWRYRMESGVNEETGHDFRFCPMCGKRLPVLPFD